jgi:cytosine/adenosine deaminase-related metal-dependent hydrolase
MTMTLKIVDSRGGPGLGTTFRERRAQANNELALQDMLASGTPPDVPRGMHHEEDVEPTAAARLSGLRWLFGIMTGLAIVEGLLLVWGLR